MEQVDLTYFFKTRSQANDFSTRLGILMQKMYQTDFNLEKELLEQFGIEKSDRFTTLLRNNNITFGTTPALKDFLSRIQQIIASMSIINLGLAFEPNQETLQALSQWFMANLNTQVLFEITIDSRLIAGSAIYHNGKFIDFSIRSEFDKVFNEIVNNNSQPMTPQLTTAEPTSIQTSTTEPVLTSAPIPTSASAPAPENNPAESTTIESQPIIAQAPSS